MGESHGNWKVGLLLMAREIDVYHLSCVTVVLKKWKKTNKKDKRNEKMQFCICNSRMAMERNKCMEGGGN